MPQNRIQFQKGMSFDEFIDHYGTESQCENALENARWGNGFSCPKCGGSSHSFFYRDDQKIWQCSAHKHQTTLRTGTLFHASKLPLRKWFMAMFLILPAGVLVGVGLCDSGLVKPNTDEDSESGPLKAQEEICS